MKPIGQRSRRSNVGDQALDHCHKLRFGSVVPYQEMLKVLEMSPRTPGYVFGLRLIDVEELNELILMLNPQ
jgi:hypothetical protein